MPSSPRVPFWLVVHERSRPLTARFRLPQPRYGGQLHRTAGDERASATQTTAPSRLCQAALHPAARRERGAGGLGGEDTGDG